MLLADALIAHMALAILRPVHEPAYAARPQNLIRLAETTALAGR